MSGGDILLQGQAEVMGNMRANGRIVFGGASDQKESPNVHNGGRLLTATELEIQSTIKVADSDQEVRSAGDIVNARKISGTSKVYEDDDSKYTRKLDTDGSLTPPRDGEAIPNPDPATLLASGAYVTHTETLIDNGNKLDLAGGVHYFPNGVRFEKGSSLLGRDTIVVGNGHDAVFKTSLGSNSTPAVVNVLALDGHQGRGTGGNIIFETGTFLQGLIYAHGNVEFNANWRVRGSVITYRGNVDAKANVHFILDRLPVRVAGFETWLLGASAMGGPVLLEPLSWQDGAK
ncbi:MAG: hypothetical protein FJX76_05710 [Armatimonadetes bacterium]|nr:hypothetical protein [Armatimonadota bacterium]